MVSATAILRGLALLWAVVGGASGVLGRFARTRGGTYFPLRGFRWLGLSVPTRFSPLLVLLLTLFWLARRWGGARHVVLPALTLGTVYVRVCGSP